jgi:hypothetical protein
MRKKLLRRGLLALAALLLVIQVLPFGRPRTNPPVTAEPAWDSPETRALAVRACFDCHSNETRWPWYAWVAPASWLVTKDVAAGRKHLNLSEWDREQRHADDAAEELRSGEMPLWFYVPLHPGAHLSPAEKERLARGLEATLGGGE